MQTQRHLTSFDVEIKRVEHGGQQILLLHLKQRRGRAEMARIHGRQRIDTHLMLLLMLMLLMLLLLMLILMLMLMLLLLLLLLHRHT